MTIRTRNIIFSSVVFLALAIIVVMVIVPLITSVMSLTEKSYDERVQIENLKMQTQSLTAVIEDYTKIAKDQEKVASAFIQKSNTLDFISTLETFANEQNLTLKIDLVGLTILNDAAEKNGAVEEIPMTLQLSGNFLNLVSFLSKLESLSTYINVHTLDFSGETSVVNLTLRANTYWK